MGVDTGSRTGFLRAIRLLAYPGALIYKLDEHGLARTSYEETEHYAVTRSFLMRPESFLKHLVGKPDEPEEPDKEAET